MTMVVLQGLRPSLAPWRYQSQVTSGSLANLPSLPPSPVLPFISCDLGKATTSLCLKVLITHLQSFLPLNRLWRIFKSLTQIVSFLCSKLSTAPRALRRKVQPLSYHSRYSLASYLVPRRNKTEYTSPECSCFSCISKPHSHRIHWWSEIDKPPLKPSLSWTRRDQAPLTRGVRISVGKRAGENPETAAFT